MVDIYNWADGAKSNKIWIFLFHFVPLRKKKKERKEKEENNNNNNKSTSSMSRESHLSLLRMQNDSSHRFKFQRLSSLATNHINFILLLQGIKKKKCSLTYLWHKILELHV